MATGSIGELVRQVMRLFLRPRISSVVTLFAVSSAVLFAQENLGAPKVMKDPLLYSTVTSLEKSLAYLVMAYRKELEYAKSQAVNRADPDEVQLINDALGGKSVNTFTSSSAKQARTKFEKGLVEVSGQFQKNATEGVVALLRLERLDEARDLKAVIDFVGNNTAALDEIVTAKIAADKDAQKSEEEKNKASRTEKRFRLEADKDWQNADIELPANQLIEIEAEGKWAPGSNSKDKDDDGFKSGDPDTYNFELRVQGRGPVFTGGTKWSFRNPQAGPLMGRMKDYNAAGRARAKGAIVVTVRWEEQKKEEPKAAGNKLLEPLEYILARYIPDGGKRMFGNDFSLPPAKQVQALDNKPNSQARWYKKVYRLAIQSDKDWQTYPVEIRPKDKLTISARGSWTPDASKPQGTADVYPYAYRIGNSQGNGKSETSFPAQAGGKLTLRIAARDEIMKNKFRPIGQIELTLTLEREGQEIK